MGITERREREKEMLRTRIVEAARDILSEHGLGGFSMREIARRIEYSPATIYLYFQGKDDLIRAVVLEGLRLLSASVREAVTALGEDATPSERYRASGYAYVRFALEHTAYFHVIFDLPADAAMECPELTSDDAAMLEAGSFERVAGLIEAAASDGTFKIQDPRRAAVVGWATLHGLLSLYLSGHLGECATTREEFETLVDWSIATLSTAWRTGVTANGAPGRESARSAVA